MNKSRFCFLLALAASGCLPTRHDSSLDPVRKLEAEVRIEIVESLENPETEVYVVFAYKMKNAVIGRSYRREETVEYTDGDWISRSSGEGKADDTTWEFSSRSLLNIVHLKGRTVRGRVSVDGIEIARDSATYY